MDSGSHYDTGDQDDFDIIMNEALARLDVMVKSNPNGPSQNPQGYNADDNTVLPEVPIYRIKECDIERDIECDIECESNTSVNLTQIYDDNSTDLYNANIVPIVSMYSSPDENKVYENTYDQYDYDENVCDSDDEVYENVEYSYHAEKMDKKTGNFGRI